MPKKSIGFILVFMVIIMFAGCQAKESLQEETEKAFPVHIEKVQTGALIESKLLRGEIAASKVINISPKISGKIESILVKKGQRVEVGQVLALIDQTDVENNLKQAQVALQSAQINVENAKLNHEKGVDQAELNLANSKIAQQEAQVAYANAKTSYHIAQANYERMLTLYEQGAIAKQEFEQAETTLSQAKAGLQQSELALQKAEAAIQSAEKGLQNAKRTEAVQTSAASMTQAQLSVELAKEQLEQTKITAPMAGEITNISLQQGELASQQTILFTLIQTEPLLVKTSVTEEMLANLELDAALTVLIKSVQEEVQGKLTFISSVTDLQTKTYPIELELSTSSSKIKPGMLAEIVVKQDKNNEESVLVPSSALILSNQEYYVFVVNGNRAERRQVDIGQENEEYVQIVAGLSAGKEIIVKGHLTLEDGALIQVAEAN